MLLSHIVGSRALVTYRESACPQSPEGGLWRVEVGCRRAVPTAGPHLLRAA